MNSKFDLFRKKVSLIADKISSFMDTQYFAVVLSVFELFCYYLELDILIIVTVSFFLSFSFIAKKNLNCLLILFLIMGSMISINNSPANINPTSNRGYYFNPAIYITCIVAAVVPIVSAIVRSILNIVRKRVKFNGLFISILVLSGAFLTNGLFAGQYTFQDTLFGCALIFFYALLFFVVLPDVQINKESLTVITRQVLIYSSVILIELLTFYISYFARGRVINPYLDVFLGWGNGNTIGMMLIVIMCFVFYAFRYEQDRGFKIYAHSLSVLIVFAIIMTFSRAAYLFIVLLIFGYLFTLCIRTQGKLKKKLIILMSSVCLAGIVVASIFYFSGIFDDAGINFSSGGRLGLWSKTLNAFFSNPIFGQGFYFLGGDPTIKLSNVMPYCCHNTILQMFGSCGLFGGIAYLTYRFFTIKEIWKNISKEKVYPVMACGMMVLMSLVDIHILDLLGSSLYIVLLAFGVSKNKDDVENKEDEVTETDYVQEKRP